MTLFALLAGLFLILKELIPLAKAWNQGVIYTRGHNRKRIERSVEPERFKLLCRNRFEGMGLGFICIGFGVLWGFIGFWALLFVVIGLFTLKAVRDNRINRQRALAQQDRADGLRSEDIPIL